ncbi:glutamate carboxypeptidase [Bradyrhizobium sp. GM0.4]
MASSNWFDSQTILDGIRRWVEVETPTDTPEQVNKLVSMVAEQYRDLPVTLERIAGVDGCGDHLVARSTWGQDRPGILVLSHLDTVHPMGFIERLPFKVEGDSAFGPGIYDMKGGAYIAHHAFRALCATADRRPLGITHLFTSDEEIGSPTSRALIETEGRKAKYVLVTEPAREGGKIVTGRKGVGRFEVFIKGVPAHAGTRPQDGRSAIRELANVILALEAMNDLARGVTVNVGVVRGGTRPNVTPEEAYAEIDLRVPSFKDADGIRRQDPRFDIEDRWRHRQGHGRAQSSALREEQCRRFAVRTCKDGCHGDRLRSGGRSHRRRLGRQFHRRPHRDARRARRRRQGRAHPL